MTRALLLRLAALVALVAALALTQRSDARACGWSISVEPLALRHPDLPLDAFAGGRLGILQRSWARSYLIVAWRWMTDLPLSRAEQDQVLALWQRRIPEVSIRAAERPPAPASPASTWQAARVRAGAPPATGLAAGAYTDDLQFVERCLPDAFGRATRHLEAKLQTTGAGDAALLEWIAAQDRVFSLCAEPSGPHPPSLPASAPAAERAERAYQQASALFYAERYDDAAAAFRAIAVDASSPHAALAAYLVARALRRKDDLPGAERACRAVLADGRLSSMHGPAQRYLDYLRFRTAPDERRAELEHALANVEHPSDLGNLLGDYTLMLDVLAGEAYWLPPPAGPAPPPTVSTEPLRAWLAAMQSGGVPALDAALAGWQSASVRTRTAWIVAVLTQATDGGDARLTPVIAAAQRVGRTDPAYVSVSFHLARLDAVRRGRTRAAHDRAVATLASLRPEDGRTTRTLLRRTAALAAPDLDAWLRASASVIAGSADYGEGSGVVQPPTEEGPPTFHDVAIAQFEHGMPLSVWARAAESPRLPAPLRSQLVVATYVRAGLLGDRAVASRLAPRVRRNAPMLSSAVDAIERARTDDTRRFELMRMLLAHPQVGPSPRSWSFRSFDAGAISTRYGEYAWCGPPDAVDPPPFVGTAERTAATREREALRRLGPSGSTAIARATAELADRLPNDARMPETLHLAVQLTRYACGDAQTRDASRAAFRALHRLYPTSDWATRTRYFYGAR